MAITLNTETSYPLNGTTTFPIGEEIVLEFNQLVDLKSAKDSVVLIHKATNTAIETDIRVLPLDANNEVLEDNFITKPESQKTLVVAKPKSLLDANTEYSLFIRGAALEEVQSLTEEFASNAISERTIYGTTLSGTYTEQVKVYGLYKGSSQQTLNIEIVLAGEGSAAKYIWWFSDEVKPQPSGSRLNKTTSRWRSLGRGCYIKFYGGEFSLGDVYNTNLFPKVKLNDSYRIDFSTSTESLLLKPEVASESDIGSIIPSSESASYATEFKILKMEPKNGSINNSLETNKITIYFNKNIDPATVSQSTVKLFKQPVSGFFSSEANEQKMPKEITVEDNKIILEF